MAEIWPFVPQREFIETLEWSTDIIQCRSAEQRLSLRPLPRLGVSYNMLLTPQEASLARTLARTASLGEFYVPMWGEATRLGVVPQGTESLLFSTASAQYEPGGLVMLFDEFNRLEVLTVETVGAGELELSSPTTKSMSSAFIMPCLLMRPSQEFEFVRAAAEDLLKVSASFFATDVMDVPAISGDTTYLSHPVLTLPPIATGSLGERVLHSSDTIDNGVGPVSVFRDLDYVTSSAYMAWDCLTREELWTLRRWLYTVRGKQKGFWRPTWGNDLQLLSSIGSSDAQMTVADVGFSGRMTDRDIMIRLASGVTIYRRVTYAEPGLFGSEVLHLDSPLGQNVTTTMVDRISFMNFARLDADRIEIRHRAARGASVQVPLTEVPQP